MQVLVTGGLGFIGSHTVVSLVEAGYEPIIVDSLSNSEFFILDRIQEILGRNVKFYKTDCVNYAELETVFKENKLQGIIHFAAHKAVGESFTQALSYYENNLLSLINILKLMKAYKVENLVFSSSCTVYGQAEKLPVNEQAPIIPALSPYANTKKIGEEIIKDAVAAQKDIKAVALRYFNPIGSHQSGLIGELPKGVPNNLVPFITQTAMGIRKQLQVYGNDYPTPDGTCIRDFIHVCDLADAHVKALEYLKNEANGLMDFVNVGTGRGVSVLEIIKTFEEVSEVKLNYVIAPRREGDITEIYADATKSKQVLKWEAKRTLRQALLDAWNWQKRLGL